MSGAAGQVVDVGKSVFNKTLNPFSDENVFRSNVGAVLFPGQNPTVQGTAAVVGSGELIAGAAGASGSGAAGGAGSAGSATAGTAAAGGTLNTLKTIATILTPAASIATTLASINESKKLAKQAYGAPQPVATPPVTMPTLGGPNTIVAQRAATQTALLRRGRASTILTGTGDKLGA